MSNLLNIILLKNKDESLKPELDRMKNYLHNSCEGEDVGYYSIGDILKDCILKLMCDFNMHLRSDFKVLGSHCELEIAFVHILQNYVRIGSKIVVDERRVYFLLKDGCNQKVVRKIVKDVFNTKATIKGNRLCITW